MTTLKRSHTVPLHTAGKRQAGGTGPKPTPVVVESLVSGDVPKSKDEDMKQEFKCQVQKIKTFLSSSSDTTGASDRPGLDELPVRRVSRERKSTVVCT